MCSAAIMRCIIINKISLDNFLPNLNDGHNRKSRRNFTVMVTYTYTSIHTCNHPTIHVLRLSTAHYPHKYMYRTSTQVDRVGNCLAAIF